MEMKRVNQIVEEALRLLERKNKDYSNSTGDNITETGLIGMATRLTDKVSRLRSLIDKPADQINFESIRDTLTDILNYSIIARMVEEGSWARSIMVYLAGPVDDISADKSHGWRATVSTAFASHGINTFNPAAAFVTGSMDQYGKKQIADIDRAAIHNCDVVLANLSGDGRAFGTIREIEYARSLNKRVIVV